MYRTPPKYRRLEHLLNNDLPTQTEIRSYLGPSLAQIFQDHSDETTRKLIGAIPPLKGPDHKDLWISPSDQLIGKIILKSPLTIERTKACTHQGILEIGKRAALQFERDTEENIREKLEKELVEKRKMFEAEKRRAIEMTVREISNNYEERIERLNEEFKKQLKEALDDAAGKSKKEMQKAVIQERLDVEMRMMKKLREEIGRVVVSLHDEFQESFQAQRDDLVANFNAIMRQERRKVDETIDCYERKRTQEMSIQRREFEIEKIANAAFIVCTERMRCDSETRTMRHNYEKQIQVLQNLLRKLREEMTTEAKIDEKSLKENNDEQHMFRLVEILDKDGQLWRPIQLEPEIPQIDYSCRDPNTSIVLPEINYFPADQYTERISHHSSTKSLCSQDSLPFCYFKDKLYIRSDYREKHERQETIEEQKTIEELAEGASFSMKLEKSCSRTDSLTNSY